MAKANLDKFYTKNESMKAFTQKHFVEEKLMALWNLILKVKTVFQTIVLQAPTSTSCSQ